MLFRLYAELLHDLHMINSDGSPVNVVPLYNYTSESYFQIVALVSALIMERTELGTAKNITSNLKLILAHLNTFPFPSFAKNTKLSSLSLNGVTIDLPALPDVVQQRITQLSDAMLRRYNASLLALASRSSTAQKTELPITKALFLGKKEEKNGPSKVSKLSEEVTSQKVEYKLRSNFVALSGRGDHCESFFDVRNGLRSDLPSAALGFSLTFAEPTTDVNGRVLPRNTFLLGVLEGIHWNHAGRFGVVNAEAINHYLAMAKILKGSFESILSINAPLSIPSRAFKDLLEELKLRSQ